MISIYKIMCDMEKVIRDQVFLKTKILGSWLEGVLKLQEEKGSAYLCGT